MSFASYLLCYLSKSRDEYEHEPELLLGDLLRAQTKQISSVNRSFFESLYLSHFTFMIMCVFFYAH